MMYTVRQIVMDKGSYQEFLKSALPYYLKPEEVTTAGPENRLVGWNIRNENGKAMGFLALGFTTLVVFSQDEGVWAHELALSVYQRYQRELSIFIETKS